MRAAKPGISELLPAYETIHSKAYLRMSQRTVL